MTAPTFATPLDSRTVAARGAPESPLLILPFEDAQRVQVVVAQRSSWRPLTPTAGDALVSYFRRDDGASFWWRTLRPAVFSLERVSVDVWVGHLNEPGEVVQAGDDPRLRPIADHVFAISQALTAGSIREPEGPVIEKDRYGADVEVYRATAARIVRARFPTRGDDVVWLRMSISEKERPEHLRTLASELAVFSALHAADPAIVPEVLHQGVEFPSYTGSFVVYRPSPGLMPGSWLLRSHQSISAPTSSARVPAEILSGICRVIEIAHASGFCAGPLTPGLFRVRPILDGRERRMRVVPIALPAAGEPGQTISSRVQALYPGADVELIAPEFSNGSYKRTLRNDAKSFGILARGLLNALEIRSAKLETMADRLISGRESDLQFARPILDAI